MVNSVRGLLLAAGVATITAGCAGQPSVHSQYRGSYDPSLLSYAASRGGMKVDILGNPFPAAGEVELAQAVTRRLGEASPGPRMDFFTEAPPAHSSPYRVVLLFDAPGGTQFQHLCTMSGQPSGQPAGDIRVSAAFCSSGVAVTRVSGSVNRGDSPDDAGFSRLVGQVGRALFPTNNPDMTDGAGDFDM